MARLASATRGQTTPGRFYARSLGLERDLTAEDLPTLTVEVARSRPGARTGFRVRRFEPMTVLDVLLAIQRHDDPSLGFRFSCRVAMCGTCTVRVDGRSVLACQEVVGAGRDRLRIGPVAGLPVVRDLIVDMAPFWRQWARVIPYLVPIAGLDEPATVRPDSPARGRIDGSLDCIQCAACFSSCGMSGMDGDFLGPAALNRAMVLISDSRDASGPERLAAAQGPSGVDRCHYIYGCSNVCPKGLDPARAIRWLRTGRVASN